MIDRKEKILKSLIKSRANWLNGKGPLSDVVVSSRIRLARNINNIPFTSRANKMELEKVFKIIQKVFNENTIFSHFNHLLLDKLSPLEIQFLTEKNLISRDFIQVNNSHRSCIFHREETLSIMINEEDHIRIQLLSAGLQLKKIWKQSMKSMMKLKKNDLRLSKPRGIPYFMSNKRRNRNERFSNVTSTRFGHAEQNRRDFKCPF